MPKRLFLLGTVMTLLLWPMRVGADERVVRFFFQSKTCPHCLDILESYLPGCERKNGDQVEIRVSEISENPDDYRIMLSLEKAYGITEEEAGVPLIFISDRDLIGSDAIHPVVPRAGRLALCYLALGS